MPDDSRGTSVNNAALQDSLKQKAEAQNVIRRGDAEAHRKAQEKQQMDASLKRAADKAARDTGLVKASVGALTGGLAATHGTDGLQVNGLETIGGGIITGGETSKGRSLDDARTIILTVCNDAEPADVTFYVR